MDRSFPHERYRTGRKDRVALVRLELQARLDGAFSEALADWVEPLADWVEPVAQAELAMPLKQVPRLGALP